MKGELPSGWTSALLSDVFANLDSRRVPVNAKERAARLGTTPERFPYFGATGQVGEIDTALFEGESVLLGEDGAPFLDPRKNKAYLVDGKYWVNNHAHVLRAHMPLSNAFFCHQLNTIDYRAHVAGTTRLKLTQSAMNEIELAVAPFNEQQRIVSKIDELFSRIEEGERALERVQKLVERYRQSVLKAAVTGELTRDWREKNQGQAETGEALLARILKVRREAWEQAELAKMDAKGVKPANDKWKQKYVEPAAPEASNLPTLPPGWVWASPVQLQASSQNPLTIGPFGSNLKVSDYTPTGVPLIFVRNIRSQQFGGTRDKYISPEKAAELSSHVARGGDVLITKMGEPPGDACVYPLHMSDAVITADCIKWSLHPLLPSAAYIAAFINSQVGKDQFSEITKGVAQQKVSLDGFRKIAIALPGTQEQQEIADRVAVESQRLEAMGAAIALEVKRAGATRQSVLSAAFRGELVPPDPADEPASLLLHRMETERSAIHAKPNRHGRPAAV